MKALSSLSPTIAILITAGALIGIGILKTSGLLDGDFANTVVAFILGGGSGAALTGGFSKGGTV